MRSCDPLTEGVAGPSTAPPRAADGPSVCSSAWRSCSSRLILGGIGGWFYVNSVLGSIKRVQVPPITPGGLWRADRHPSRWAPTPGLRRHLGRGLLLRERRHPDRTALRRHHRRAARAEDAPDRDALDPSGHLRPDPGHRRLEPDQRSLQYGAEPARRDDPAGLRDPRSTTSWWRTSRASKAW